MLDFSEEDEEEGGEGSRAPAGPFSLEGMLRDLLQHGPGWAPFDSDPLNDLLEQSFEGRGAPVVAAYQAGKIDADELAMITLAAKLRAAVFRCRADFEAIPEDIASTPAGGAYLARVFNQRARS